MPVGTVVYILSPFLGNLLLHVLENSISNFWSYNEDLNELRETLKKGLDELENTLIRINKRNPIESSISWLLEDIEELWYRMDDIKDKPKDLKTYLPKFLRNCISKVKNMQAELERIQKRMEREFPQDQASSGQSGSQQEFWEDQILWVEDKNTIIKQLKEGPSSSMGVTIVGISGSGKTQLVKAVANDKGIKEHFHCICSPDPSPNFNFDCVTKKIVAELPNMPHKRIRVLILLDGLQTVDSGYWRPFRKFFRGKFHPESKVLVTTQNPQIADATGSSKHCQSKLLNDECYKLILNLAGTNENLNDFDKENIDFYKDTLFGKCLGLPLLANRIGLLLSATGEGNRRSTIDEIIRQDLWKWDKFESDLRNTTLVSLLQRKPQLKRCLDYCSLFPPNAFNKDLVVQLWMAEGFTQCQTGVEEFEDLLSHSIFQSSDNSPSYEMHQLAYDFAKNFTSRAFYRKDMASSTSHITKFTRHISLSCTKNIEKGAIENAQQSLSCTNIEEGTIENAQQTLAYIENTCKDLRTFYLFEDAGELISKTRTLETPTFFERLTRLRVLNLSHTSLPKLSPTSISKLGCLRYLDLSFTYIKEVPSLSKNAALQVLKLNGCTKLLTLPDDLVNLSDLVYLQVNMELLTAMPPKMGQLKKLRALELFIVGKTEGKRIEELKEMNDLRESLQITKLENVNSGSDAEKAELKKKRLHRLELHWSDDSKPNEETEKVLGGLVPPQTLNELRITNYCGSQFPQWLSDKALCGFTTIHLDNCMGCSNLPSLGKLGMLKHVYIRRMKNLSCVSPEFCEENSFPFLESLELSNLPELKKWPELKAGCMPNLHSLRIEECQKLDIWPSMAHLTSLKKLQIIECRGLKELPKLSSSVDVSIENCSGDLKLHCLDVRPYRCKIDGIQATTISKLLPHQSSSIQIGDLPTVNDSNSRELHEDHRLAPSLMDASRSQLNGHRDPAILQTPNNEIQIVQGFLNKRDNPDRSMSKEKHNENEGSSSNQGNLETSLQQNVMIENRDEYNSVEQRENLGTRNEGQPSSHTIPLSNGNDLQEHPNPSKRPFSGGFRRFLSGCFSLGNGPGR